MANTSIPSLPGPGGRPGKGVFGFGAAGLAVAGLALILLYIISPFYTVGEYERTVVTRFGQFHSLAGPGLHFRIPFVNGLETFPIGIQRMQKDHLNTYTVDNQELDALVTLNYRIPENEVRQEVVLRHAGSRPVRWPRQPARGLGALLGRLDDGRVASLPPLQDRTKKKDACARGGWLQEARGNRRGRALHNTAMNVLTLEVYYRFGNVFGAAAREGGG